MRIEKSRFTNQYATPANCVRALVVVKRPAYSTKPMGLCLTHRLWATASPPDEVFSTN